MQTAVSESENYQHRTKPFCTHLCSTWKGLSPEYYIAACQLIDEALFEENVRRNVYLLDCVTRKFISPVEFLPRKCFSDDNGLLRFISLVSMLPFFATLRNLRLVIHDFSSWNHEAREAIITMQHFSAITFILSSVLHFNDISTTRLLCSRSPYRRTRPFFSSKFDERKSKGKTCSSSRCTRNEHMFFISLLNFILLKIWKKVTRWKMGQSSYIKTPLDRRFIAYKTHTLYSQKCSIPRQNSPSNLQSNTANPAGIDRTTISATTPIWHSLFIQTFATRLATVRKMRAIGYCKFRKNAQRRTKRGRIFFQGSDFARNLAQTQCCLKLGTGD